MIGYALIVLFGLVAMTPALVPGIRTGLPRTMYWIAIGVIVILLQIDRYDARRRQERHKP